MILKIPECFDVITCENVDKYRVPGIWIMFGTSKIDSKIYCLNVGKNDDIGKELDSDFKRLISFSVIKEKRHPYVNQFGVVLFKYPIYSDRQDYLYREISSNYKDIFAVKVYDKSDYDAEKYCAYLFRAKYWVSNGRYKHEVSENEIKKILNSMCKNPFDEFTNSQLELLYDEYNK